MNLGKAFSWLFFLVINLHLVAELSYSDRKELVAEGEGIIERGVEKEILEFVEKVEKIENEWELPRSIIQIAASSENLDIALLIIENGSQKFCPSSITLFKNSAFTLPLLKSIKAHHPSCFEKSSTVLLTESIVKRRADLVDFFIQSNVELNVDERPVLPVALSTYQLEVVEKLVEAGADPDARTGDISKKIIDGKEVIHFDTMVDFAYKLKFLEALEYLDKAGAYDEQIEELRVEFRHENESKLVGAWESETHAFSGSNSLLIKKDATAILRAGSINFGFMWKRIDSGAELFPVDLGSGRIGRNSKTYVIISEDGSSLDLKKGDGLERFMRAEVE